MELRTILFAVLIVAINSVYAESIETPSDANRVVGGENARKGQFPYIVSFRGLVDYFDPQINVTIKRYSHFCGGSILNDQWVVTAAHCTVRLASIHTASIFVGAHSYDGIRYALQQYISHPEYDPNRVKNDIALLKTSHRIQFNARVQPISISRRHINGGLEAMLSGWGRVKGGSAGLPKYLQFAKLFTLSNEECIDGLPENVHPIIFESTLCAIEPAGKAACNGDSGGPLVVDEILVGIVSWGMLGCKTVTPGAYVRVSHYIDWIVNHTGVEVLD